MTQSFSFFPFCVLAVGFAVGSSTATAVETVLQFSNPDAPGTVVVQTGPGDVILLAEDRRDICVQGDVSSPEVKQPRADGLRRLDGDAEFTAAETDNVVTIRSANLIPGTGGDREERELTISVPRTTMVRIERNGPGATVVRGLAGDLEVRSAVGDVELDEVAGGVLVETVTGDVAGTLADLDQNKGVAVTVVHGSVTLHLPVEVQANLRMRCLRGEMLTDFGEDRLQSSFENDFSGGEHATARTALERARESVKRTRETVNRAAVEAERAVRQGVQGKPPSPPAPPAPPKPMVMPQLPAMAGGKLVVGTLNGGGAEISITTLTGDITLRRRE